MPSNSLRILATGMGWPSLQPGGLNTYFKSICEHLSADHDLHALICTKDKPQVQEGMLVTNLADPQTSIGKRREVFRQHAARMLDEQKFDVVYSHFAPYGIGVAMEAKKRNVPVVMAFHGPWSEEIQVEGGGIKHRMKAWIARRIELKAYSLADAFIVLSETFRDILHHHYQVPLHKIHIIAGAADTARFQPSIDPIAVRDQLGLAQDSITVLTVRRLVKRMGLLQLLDAWQEVVKQAPSSMLLIGGKGPLKEELEKRIIEYGLQDHVRMLGYVSDQDLPRYYQAADLFVVPTQALEGFGLITVEAMSSGLPVMATPIGGSREILEKFDSDMLFKSVESHDMASGMIRIINNRERWPSAEQCRSHILEYYTWEQVTKRVEAVFDKVTGQGSNVYGRDRLSWSPNGSKGGRDTNVKSRLY
ncbi:Mannosylfructose-phosphate synthase [compost metagenome]